MNIIYKTLLNDIPELIDACNKLLIYVTNITFYKERHCELGNVLKINTICKTYNLSIKKSVIINDTNSYKYYNLQKILEKKQMSVLNDPLSESNYNEYKTALKSICQIIIDQNSDYSNDKFDLFYFLFLSSYIQYIHNINRIDKHKNIFHPLNTISQILLKMNFQE